MAAVRAERVSAPEYLAYERAAEGRHELVDGRIIAMSGGTFRHSLITANIGSALAAALRERPCLLLSPDMRIKTADRYTYADVSIVCGPFELEDQHQDTLLNPSVIIEVLSPSTESYDRGVKFASYRTLTSMTDYILVAQDKVHVEHFRRQPGDAWLLRTYGPGQRLVLDSIGCAIEIDEFYRSAFAPGPASA
jgi:Uma2 family endonuclease